MSEAEEHYFRNNEEWREWLLENHHCSKGVYLIFYRIESKVESMRWEDAVKEALCFGWIDSTVKKIDDERRRQYFCPRKDNSVWSRLNKSYIEELIEAQLMHESGLRKIEMAKANGSWTALDDVEALVIPEDLKKAFSANPKAFRHYRSFSKTYKKGYLYWLNQAKRETTRANRIVEIIALCEQNIKARQ